MSSVSFSRPFRPSYFYVPLWSPFPLFLFRLSFDPISSSLTSFPISRSFFFSFLSSAFPLIFFLYFFCVTLSLFLPPPLVYPVSLARFLRVKWLCRIAQIILHAIFFTNHPALISEKLKCAFWITNLLFSDFFSSSSLLSVFFCQLINSEKENCSIKWKKVLIRISVSKKIY